jgi:hypothetical protein
MYVVTYFVTKGLNNLVVCNSHSIFRQENNLYTYSVQHTLLYIYKAKDYM